MSKYTLLFGIIGIIGMYSCTPRYSNSGNAKEHKELSAVVEMMTGTFSSAEQAQQDSLFYDISLTMVPIWEEDKTAKWLYVEQAVTRNIKKPYRQRVYRVTMNSNKMIESRVYTLPNPKKYIHGWEQPTIFNQITSDSLMIREGCAVYLNKEGNCFSGSTKDKDCKSSLRGASYATSIVSICKDAIISWDQGWNSNDEQVWGAETKGYIFKKN